MDFKDSITMFGTLAVIATAIGGALIRAYVGPTQKPTQRQVGHISAIIIVALIIIIAIANLIPHAPGIWVGLVRSVNISAATQFARTATAQTRSTNVAVTNTARTATTTAGISVAETADANAKKAVDASTNPYYPYTGMLALTDSLKDNSKGFNWSPAEGASPNDCAFIANAYYVSEEAKGYFDDCIAQKTNYNNFVYQAQMTIFHGDCGGLIFRRSTSGKFYYFQVCLGGGLSLRVFTNGGSGTTVANANYDVKINIYKEQTYLIAVVVRGGGIDLYINLQRVITTFDATINQGQIGFASSYGDEPGQVAYSHAKVWIL